jgi:hypothetical protein
MIFHHVLLVVENTAQVRVGRENTFQQIDVKI